MQDRQRSQPKEIHLEQAEVVQRTHRILRDHFLFLRVAAQRDVFRKIAIADDDAGRVHSEVARPPFQQDRVVPQLPRRRFRIDGAPQLRIRRR